MSGQTYGEDNCVLDKPCPICDAFSHSQKELLATPSYRIRKDKKAGLLVSPKDVTVVSSVDTEPVFYYVVTLRRGRTRTRPREQLLLQNYKA